MIFTRNGERFMVTSAGDVLRVHDTPYGDWLDHMIRSYWQ